jgi:(p)ppGpp synthase/HD superfamily hydrolase
MGADERLTAPLSDRFDRALAYAAALHREQARKGTNVPYVSHLLAVAGLVLEQGGTEDQAIAALLHDAIEDQGGAATGEAIRTRFGDGVYALVQGCTDTELDPKPPWRPRKEAYLARVRGAEASVKLISAADKVHNARTILLDYRDLGDAVWERFHGGKQGTLWYHRELVSALRDGEQTEGLRRLVDELERVVGELERLTGT